MRQIPFSRIDCTGNEIKYVTEVIQSGWLTTAARCAEFEERMAARVGARYACAVNSATAALHLACEAVGIGPGDQVLAPTMTFTATAEVVRYLGGDPVFLDVDAATCLVTPEILKAAIPRYPRAKALMLVHFGGQAAEVSAIRNICRDHDLRLIEDAAHAFPASHDGRTIGSFGDATCFSFYANKTITTGEGGMLVTDDRAIWERARVMRLHGIDRDVWKRFTSRSAEWEYDVVAPGYKYNLPDIAAAIGLAQLERADEFRQARQRCAQYYLEKLSGIEGLDLPVCQGPPEDHAWHLFRLLLNARAPIDRNTFIARMTEAGIGTSVHYKPLHRMTYYRQRYNLDPRDFPNAERVWSGTVSLPVYPGLDAAELAYIVETVRHLLTHHGQS